MGDGLRTIRVVTTDESLIASARAAASAIGGWEVVGVPAAAELLDMTPSSGDVVLLDNWMRGANVYEACRRLAGQTRCRTFIVAEHENRLAEPIARFCGASGVLHRPLVPSKLRDALSLAAHPRPPLPRDGRGEKKEGSKRDIN